MKAPARMSRLRAALARSALGLMLLAGMAAGAGAADNKRFNEALRAYQYGAYEEAIQLFLPQADEGDPDAQYYVGFMYAQGLGVQQDYGRAAAWYERAALQGHAPAQNYLGLLHFEGRGMDRDFRTAFIYFELAAAQGNQDGLNNRLIVARKMTTDQITDAQKAAGRLIRQIDATEGIRLPNSLGSGVVVSSEGHILTHASVIEGCRLIKVRRAGRVEDADVALRDSFNDLVLLRADHRLGDPAVMRAGEPAPDETVTVFGHHVDDDLAISPRIADAVVRDSPNLVRTDRRYFEIAPGDPLFEGNGAPVYDQDGLLVGIVVADTLPEAIGRVTGPLPPSQMFALRADLVSVVMHIEGIAHRAVRPGVQLAAEQAEQPESASAVAVECWLGDGVTITPGAVSRMRGASR